MTEKISTSQLMGSIAELSEYLSRKEVTSTLLTQFLVLRTLRALNISQVFLSQLHPDGLVRTIDSFGITQEEMKSWNDVNLSNELPITRAIRECDLVWLADGEDWERDYPNAPRFPGNRSSQTVIINAIDIHGAPAGALGMISEKIVKSSPERVEFIRTVSSLVAFFMSTVNSGRFENIVRGNIGASGEYMSPRQMRILDLMAQELTNPQIARELGFSESTVRQETMRIYQILQVSGRKEAIREAHHRNIAKILTQPSF